MAFELESYKYSEYDGQIAVVGWLELLKNQTKKLSYNAPPNQHLSLSQIGAAKKAGMRAGWPDIQIYLEHVVIFIEYKYELGTLKENQKDIHRELRDLDYPVYVVRYSIPNECIEKTAAILREHGLAEAVVA